MSGSTKSDNTRARRAKRLALLLCPFVLGPLAIRALVVGPLSDALATGAIALAPTPSVAIAADPPPSLPPPNNGGGGGGGAMDESPRGELAPPPTRHRHAAGVSPNPTNADAGTDAAAPKPINLDAPSKGTIVVPAAIIAKAIEKKDVGATDAKDADGKPLGARIHGVGKYRAGLRDGDIIIYVAGTRTESTQQMMDAGARSLVNGATKLTGKILRGPDHDQLFDVVLELPPR